MNRQVRLFISGRVQGVFFRASTRKQAQKLGINGFARNLLDSRVEVVADGEAENVAKLVAWCHQGPLGAKVDHVTIQEISKRESYSGFSIS